MNIESLELTDFRGISHLEVPFNKKLTVIVGKNGAGKTSILDALAALLMGYRNMWRTPQEQVSTVTPSQSDITYRKSDYNIQAVAAAGIKDNLTVSKSIYLTSDARDNYQRLHKLFSAPTPLEHPLFVYYRQDRNFHTQRQSHQPSIDSPEQIRENSLSPDLRAISGLNIWIDKLDAQEARRHRDVETGYRDPRLKVVRHLVQEIEESWGIGFDADRANHGLYIDKEDGNRVYIDQLSSGERVYLILLIDLARRLQVIRPHENLGDIPGIVLIDEIELNLHPDWQRKIIPTLANIFRRCQFIVTTHSPQVIGEVSGENVFILSRDGESGVKWCRFGEDTFGRDSNELLIKVLGASERNQTIKKQLELLEELIGGDELEEAEKVIQGLKGRMGGYVVELEIAEDRLHRRRGKLKG